jgi:hypothetical protein
MPAKKTIPTNEHSGRNRAEIDWAIVDRHLFAGVDGVTIAGVLGVAPITLYRACERTHSVNFDVYKQQKRAVGLDMLRLTQHEIAVAGNVPMAIWLGKQFLGQSEKADIKSDVAITPRPIIVDSQQTADLLRQAIGDA